MKLRIIVFLRRLKKNTIFLLFFFSGALEYPLFAQNILYDEGSGLWNSDTYIEDSKKNGDVPDSIQELDRGDYQYYSEEEIYQIERDRYLLSSNQINYQEAAVLTTPTFKDNILYGVGTGLVIGAWFAVFNKGTARQNFQFLGTGGILGGVMGFLVGTKAYYIAPPKKFPQQKNQRQDPYGFFQPSTPEPVPEKNMRLALDFEVNF